MKNVFFPMYVVVFFGLLVSCKSVPISQLSQEDGIQRIRSHYTDEEWTNSITEIDEYKTRYPYSKYNVEAELMQADAYFQAARYPEAIIAYEDFIRKNPNNKNIPLAYFRMGKSYELQDPEAPDREQLNAQRAIGKYNYFIKNYPTSEFIKEAKEQVEMLNFRLAQHSNFVANFYWNKELYSASLYRYLDILHNYAQYKELKEVAKTRAFQCYLELANILEKNPESDQYLYFKNSKPEDLRKQAEELKGK